MRKARERVVHGASYGLTASCEHELFQVMFASALVHRERGLWLWGVRVEPHERVWELLIEPLIEVARL